jgi:transcriptional regulator
MYIPNKFQENDRAKLLAFMNRYPFALLITNDEQRPWATHLPFTIEASDDGIKLYTHLAKANRQWQLIEQGEVLVVFTEPHAYISPTNYERQENVPTWNYIAVHTYGKVRILPDEDKVNVLEKVISAFEPAYLEQFKQLKPGYLNGMLGEIVALEITVTDLQGKFKLSQNKTETERQNIINSLSQSEDTSATGMAEAMRQYYDQH